MADGAAHGSPLPVRFADSGNVVQLPLWPEPKRGAPNTVLRSALFAAIHGQSRRWMKEEVLASLNGITVKYTGQQLTQSDLDVWETLIHLAREHPLGTECAFTAYGLLTALDRNTGRSEHRWLHSALIRLGACMTEITYEGKTYAGSLLDEFRRDDRSKAYRISLNPELIKLFGENQWTQLDWAQRRRVARQPLAQALHAFWSSHAAPLPVRVETLHGLTGSNTKCLRHFKANLKAALEQLVEIGFLREFAIAPGKEGRDVVTVKRERPWESLPTKP
ncbi:MAG: plasmid replication initiator TrfA [Polyangiaceae bacterium]